MDDPPVLKRVEKMRLYPSARQREALHFMLDVTRNLYNAALQERRDAYRDRGISINAKTQYHELTDLRDSDARVAAVYQESEAATIRKLDIAMQAFFRRVKRGEKSGFPRFKPWFRWHSIAFPHGDRALKLNAVQRKISVPGVGKISLRKGRPISAFGRAWLVEKNDRWYACFEYEQEVVELPATGVTLGIDRGSHVLAALSDGKLIRNAAVGEKCKVATKRLQRELEALSVYGSSGKGRRCINRNDPQRIAAIQRLATHHERLQNARLDYAHKISRTIVNAVDIIGLEDLKLRNMTRSAKGTAANPGKNVAAKAALNRVILDASLGLLQELIRHKAEEAGRVMVLVDPKFSSRECAHCAHVARENRRRRRFVCVKCGYRNHADVNAALVIRRRAELRLSSGQDAQSATVFMPHAGEEPVVLHDAA